MIASPFVTAVIVLSPLVAARSFKCRGDKEEQYNVTIPFGIQVAIKGLVDPAIGGDSSHDITIHSGPLRGNGTTERKVCKDNTEVTLNIFKDRWWTHNAFQAISHAQVCQLKKFQSGDPLDIAFKTESPFYESANAEMSCKTERIGALIDIGHPSFMVMQPNMTLAVHNNWANDLNHPPLLVDNNTSEFHWRNLEGDNHFTVYEMIDRHPIPARVHYCSVRGPIIAGDMPVLNITRGAGGRFSMEGLEDAESKPSFVCSPGKAECPSGKSDSRTVLEISSDQPWRVRTDVLDEDGKAVDWVGPGAMALQIGCGRSVGMSMTTYGPNANFTQEDVARNVTEPEGGETVRCTFKAGYHTSETKAHVYLGRSVFNFESVIGKHHSWNCTALDSGGNEVQPEWELQYGNQTVVAAT